MSDGNDLIARLCFTGVVNGGIRNGPNGRPGEVVEKCGEDLRRELRALKSDDLRDVRIEPWMVETDHGR